MAKQSDGRVMLVNVVPIMPVMMLDTVPVSYEAEVADKAQASLADLARPVDLRRERVSAVVKIGGVYHEVLDVARRKGPTSCWSARIGRPWRLTFSARTPRRSCATPSAPCSCCAMRAGATKKVAG